MKEQLFRHEDYGIHVNVEGRIRISWLPSSTRLVGELTPEEAAKIGARLLKAATYSVANSAHDVAVTLHELEREDVDLLTPARELDRATSRFQQMIEEE